MVMIVLTGCGSLKSDPDPREVTCESGEVQVLQPDQPSEARTVDGTLLRHCLDADGARHGRHVELFSGGSPAAMGQWAHGEPQGTWTYWTPDGVFLRRSDYVAGRPDGLEQVVSDDGLILQIRYANGVADDLTTLPAETAMPEWVDGKATTGLRHRSVADP